MSAKTKTKRELARDIVAAVAGLVLAGLYWAGAMAIPSSSLIGKGVGADALPRALAVVMAVLCLLLIVQRLWAWPKAIDAARTPAEIVEERHGYMRAGGMLLIGIAFLALLGWLGYILSIFLLICATAIYNGRRLTAGLTLFATTITVSFYLLFDTLLHIRMPAGIWPALWRSIAG